MESVLFFTIALISITGNYAVYNYHSSYDYVNDLNSQNLSWKADINFGADLSFDQMEMLAGSAPPRSKPAIRIKIAANDDDKIQYPETLDLRKQHPYCPSIGAVYNQGNCRSAWAIAPASTLTDHVCIRTKGNQQTPFSAYHVVTCCRLCGRGCKGGWDDSAFFFFRRHGAITGGDYKSNTGCQPYEIEPCTHSPSSNDTTGCLAHGIQNTPQCRTKCTNLNHKIPFNKDKYKMKDLGGCEYESDAKQVLSGYGPLELNIPIYTDFIHYKSGIYKKSPDAKLIGYHNLKVIGYGKEGSTKYWIVINSWGKDWGMNGSGYIAIEYNGMDFVAGKMQYPILNK